MAEDDWLTARDRAVTYVRAFCLPPLEGLECAAEALKRAQALPGGHPQASPIAETMRQLRNLLEQRFPLTKERPERGGQPPLNRGAMVPERMDRRL